MPASNFSKSEQYQRKQYQRSLDTIRVHNLRATDFVFWFDRYGPQAKQYVIPNRQKDIGFGKGNQHLPRYAAELYTRKIIQKTIIEKSEREWDKEKKNYRKDEWHKEEGKQAIRFNNKHEWKELFPKIWLGVVERYTNPNVLTQSEVKRNVKTGDIFKDIQKEFDTERMINDDQEEAS